MTGRKIRVGDQKAKSAVVERERFLSPEELTESQDVTIEEAGSLNDSELTALVDQAYFWDLEQKELAGRVKNAKTILLRNARAQEWKSYSGESAACKIGKSTKSIMGTVKEFLQLLKREGKMKLLDDLLKVKLGDAKKYLGEDALNGFLTEETEEYGSVSLKKK